MDKIRRGMIITAPFIPLLGLSGCNSEGDPESEVATGRAQAMTITATNNPGLNVTRSGTALLDAIFTNEALNFKPNPNMVHGCRNGTRMQLTMWAEVNPASNTAIKKHQSLCINIDAPVIGKTIVLNGTGTDLPLFMVNQVTPGKASVDHFEYQLKSGSITITALYPTEVTLQFTKVTGYATPKTSVPNTQSLNPLVLDGLVTVTLKSFPAMAWLA